MNKILLVLMLLSLGGIGHASDKPNIVLVFKEGTPDPYTPPK